MRSFKQIENTSTILTEKEQKQIMLMLDEFNSNKDEKEKIGYNIKYRVVKSPLNSILTLRDEGNENKKVIESLIKEKSSQLLIEEKNRKIKEEYEYEASKEILRLKNLLMKLNEEDTKLIINNGTKENIIKDIKEKICEENKKFCHVLEEEVILNDLEKEYHYLKNKYEKKLMLQNYFFDIEVICNKEKIINNENEKWKKFICILCKEKPKEIFYCDCFHFTFCKECYNKNLKKYGNRCPICNKCNSLVIKVSY